MQLLHRSLLRQILRSHRDEVLSDDVELTALNLVLVCRGIRESASRASRKEEKQRTRVPVLLLVLWQIAENLLIHDVLDADEPRVGLVRVIDDTLADFSALTVVAGAGAKVVTVQYEGE